jgi:hypothetical protein
MYNSIIISDSDSAITYQIQAHDPRPRCVSLLERAHTFFGLSLFPQPNAVIFLALTKCPTQNLPNHSLLWLCKILGGMGGGGLKKEGTLHGLGNHRDINPPQAIMFEIPSD